MRILVGILVVLTAMTYGCSEERGENESLNMFGEYFYAYDTIPKVYVYRDVVGGLEEQFHRVFCIDDSEGKHIVVEIYTDDGRIIEALNYNLDSLDLIDHMVVDRMQVKTKTELFKSHLIPMDKESKAQFASRFPGIMDSTLFLKEIDRTYGSEKKIDVLGKKVDAVIFNDEVRLTLFNPFTRMESVKEGKAVNYFAKGYGLVEWHTPDKAAHYKLEKILSQNEFVNLMSNR